MEKALDTKESEATVKAVKTDGTGIEVRLSGQTRNLARVQNATGRKIVMGQLVLVRYTGVITEGSPAYITAILAGAID